MKRYFLLIVFFWSCVLKGNSPNPSLEMPTGLFFLENGGQWQENILYKCDFSTGHIYALENRLFFHFLQEEDYTHFLENRHNHAGVQEDSVLVRQHGMALTFLGANQTPHVYGQKQLEGITNFYIGNDKSKHASGLHSFSDIIYSELYDGVSLKLHTGDNTFFKYEFLVKPHVSTNQIVMHYEGVERLSLNELGQLRVQTSVNHYYEKEPFAYQDIDGKRVIVACAFKLLEDNCVSFELGKYNKLYPLVIDPEFVFATHTGSTADNWGNTACFDQHGNTYIGGTVFWDDGGGISPGYYPTSLGAFQAYFYGGDVDMGIMKLDSAGKRAIYSTYLGGRDSDVPLSLVVSDEDELYVLGVTGSIDFPMFNGFDTTFNLGSYLANDEKNLFGGYGFLNGTDMVIAQFSNTGESLKGSTYFGGEGNDAFNNKKSSLTHNYGDELRADIFLKDSRVYVIGTTNSKTFPYKRGGHKTVNGDSTDAMIGVFSSDFSELHAYTFYGSDLSESGLSIQLNSKNQVVIGGGTIVDSTEAGYVAVLDSDLKTVLHQKIINTDRYDQVYFVQLDSDDNVYVLGQSLGDLEVSENVYSNLKGANFIQKYSSDLDEMLFSTLIGNASTSSSSAKSGISPTAFLVDDCNNIYVSGWAGEANDITVNYKSTRGFPVTKDAFKKSTDGSDFYLMVLSEDAKELVYATYFGGNKTEEHVDGGTSRFDKRGVVYQSVCACGAESSDFVNAVDVDNNPSTFPKLNGSMNCNNGVFKFDLSLLRAESNLKTGQCLPFQVVMTNKSVGGENFLWLFGDGESFETTSLKPISHIYEKEGKYEVKLIAYGNPFVCNGLDTAIAIINVADLSIPSQINYDTACQGAELLMKPKMFDRDKYIVWYPHEEFSDSIGDTQSLVVDSKRSFLLKVVDTLGCERFDSIIVASEDLKPDFGIDVLGDCIAQKSGISVRNNTQSNLGGIRYFWDFGDGESSEEEFPNHQYEIADSFWVKVDAEGYRCHVSDSVLIHVQSFDFGNVITPNFNGANDFFEIETSTGELEGWKFEVYSRWGKEVYLNENYKNDWSGEFLEDGVYYYLITSPTGSECKSWLKIIR